MIYGREALRRFREEHAQIEKREARGVGLLSHIPADAPVDNATITVWNGERWVAWEKWLATAPIIVEERPPKEEATAPVKQAAPTADSRPRGSNEQRGLW